MTPAASIINHVTTYGLDDVDHHRYSVRRAAIPGWSTPCHALFFKAVLAELFGREADYIPSILICGVYHGLDLALIADLAARHHRGREYRLTGVDLFSAEPCADWPAEKRGLTWQQAFGCEPPSIDAARRNCPSAEIVQASSIDYLAQHAPKFDFIYLDTSHDEQTVRQELTVALINPTPGLLVAGDDYTADGGFIGGVATAVSAMLPNHIPLFNRVWLAEVSGRGSA